MEELAELPGELSVKRVGNGVGINLKEITGGGER